MNEHAAVKLLLKPIYLDDAPATGLNAAFALPPDADDCIAYFWRIWDARLTDAAAQLEASITDPRFPERLERALIRHRPRLLRKGSCERPNVILTALLETIKPFGSRRAGRPGHSNEFFAQLYADVQFLKQKFKSVRNICSRLSTMKGYKERYGRFNASALRKTYQEAVKLKDSNWQFRVFLSGPEVLMAASQIDPAAAAIERHALRT